MIVLDEISLRLAGRLLIDHASVAIPEGARVGVVGRNGSGKTTLFKALVGELELESGAIRLPSRTRIGRVAQEAPAGPDSLLERVLAADTERAALMAERESATDGTRMAEIETRLIDIDAHSAPARAATILAGLGFDESAQSRPCAEFSGGWRMRVALAALLFTEPDLLLLDEPTNYLDLEGTLWLQDYLANYPRTVILISHDRDLLDTSVDHILHLANQKLTLYKGGFTGFDRQRRERLLLDQKARKKQDAKRAHMESFVARFRAKATKAKQAQSRLKALAKMEPLSAEVSDEAASISIRHPERLLSPPIVVLDHVAVGYVPGKPVLRGLDLRIDEDDRIALLGPNGNGKSTFAKLLADRLKADSGNVVRADKLEVAYLAQHQLDELHADESPAQHVRRLMKDAPESRVRGRAAEMGFSGGAADTKVSALSGGEKARLLLGLACFNGPHLLILDEPTNHLDIEARSALIEALNDFPGAVILISHDRHLLEACAERLWRVAGGTVKPYDGDLDQYRREVLSKSDGDRMTGDGRRDRAEARAAEGGAKRRTATGPIKKRIRELEGQVDKLEKEIAEIDLKLSEPGMHARKPFDAARFAKAREEAVAALGRAEEAWLAASAELEEAGG
ncbi:ABC-F family ATP-binding cassette domain-containing protein [Xanthobacter tagetidis]|jgi:ATP-binding cassette subfamily F protein 3|uniref:ABC transporter ATP-binding protein n=1 Tax=Xanthobacter tagetidis TaxID=60216 RepID=A0A3L7AJX0_9HYPH|nr:ABC-F family ATP-binding cassette domain-containing protein [Xanthobacter tagetidis]MBB6306926.1 ATP-binding cassette subfamily F protein 3 [Xanthobacter tagetidis]RLP80010.1 ABC transporter ATP-binding protein [Xanthobacter tagetidis]